MQYHKLNAEDAVANFKNRILKDRITFTFIYKHKLEVCNDFSKFCSRFNLDYEKIKMYSYKHDLDYINSIIHFKPEYYINILGELVITDNS